MNKGLASFLLLLVAPALLVAQQPLPITRVLLYKNGMAYIVRTGQLTAPVSLSFHPEDMNDVLKSFSAWNPASGALYSVGYTTGIPSNHMLARFPFDISKPDTGLGGFLTQVKGADVHLDLSGKNLEGKLAAVQQTARAAGPQTSESDYRLTVLLRDGSLQTVWLSEVRSVEFVDPQLRAQLRSYLDVLAEGRQDVTREVSVYPVPAPGPIQVAYLQQFPLWKTSYRVDIGRPESRIQGWAQIDNPTGESWENVEVSLLSGAPVSFVMNLYQPLYTNRATVPVPGGQVAAPRQYEAAVSGALDTLAANRAFAPAGGSASARGAGSGGGTGGGLGRGAISGGTVAGSLASPALPPMAESVTFQEATTTQIEDFFEYRFPFPVRLASRQSALLPFLQKTLTIERMSIFNARTDRGNPRLGARVDNTTDIPFEPGPVTFFEDARYAGEAVLDYLARGEKRLVSYGVDHDIQIANRQQSLPERSTRLTINKGVAVLVMESLLTTTYEIRDKGKENRTLIIEHPRLNGRTLTGAEPWETTESFYRFRQSLNPGQSTELAVAEVTSRQTTVALHSLSRQQLVLFAGKETPQTIREKLGQIVDAQEQIAALTSELGTAQESINSLYRDQERLRENIKALRETRDDLALRSRYLGQLKGQEDQIDTSRARVESIMRDLAGAEGRLGTLISTLSWEG